MTKLYEGDVISVAKADWNHGVVRPAVVVKVFEDGSVNAVCFSSTVKIGRRFEARKGEGGNGLVKDSWLAAISYRKGGVAEDACLYGLSSKEVLKLRGWMNDEEWADVRAEVKEQLAKVW